MDSLPEVVFHVYPADCDMLGHVNHATMLAFLERARWELFEREGSGGVRDFATVLSVRNAWTGQTPWRWASHWYPILSATHTPSVVLKFD